MTHLSLLLSVVIVSVIVTSTLPSNAFAQDENSPLFDEGGNTVPTGEPAPPNYFPGSTKLTIGDGTCSGTLIAPRVVVTARHCILKKFPSTDLRGNVTAYFRDHKNCGTAYTSKSFSLTAQNVYYLPRIDPPVRPKDVNGVANADDVALILLPDPVPCSDTRVVPIRPTGMNTKFNYVAGWGLSLNIEAQTDNTITIKPGKAKDLLFLQPGSLIVTGSVEDAVFKVAVDLTISIDNISIKITNPLCQGDSGGSFFLSNSNDVSEYFLTGILMAYDGDESAVVENSSVQAMNCLGGKSGYVAGVTQKLEWIEDGYRHFGL